MHTRRLVAGLTVWLALTGAAPGAADPLTGMHVQGVGEVRVVPDMARVTLDVRREGSDAAALKAELDRVTAAVLQLADDLGVDERHVTAAAVSIYPRYRPRDDGQELDGVVASRTIEVTVMDLDILARLVNGALDAGANGVGGVELDASNRSALEDEALDLAIDNAVDQARRMADRFEVTLGHLIDASSGGQSAPQPMLRAAMMERSSADSSFAPGEIVIRRDVQATFAIRP